MFDPRSTSTFKLLFHPGLGCSSSLLDHCICFFLCFGLRARFQLASSLSFCSSSIAIVLKRPILLIPLSTSNASPGSSRASRRSTATRR